MIYSMICACCNLEMKVQKRKIFKFMVLIALLVLFYVYYFRVVFMQFTDQLTNTAKFEEKITVTGKSLSEALLFAEHQENMLCTKNVLNVKHNFCSPHVQS